MHDEPSSLQNITHEALADLALQVIDTELAAIEQLKSRIDENFISACRLLLACSGKVVLIGMGKSGHIAQKIAATLASTGTPSFYVHPGEAGHGDMGMISPGDVAIAISYSGFTREVIDIAPLIKRKGIPLIAMTGKCPSDLASAADVVLDVGVEREACPLGLAPTSSTTACLVMGDALAIALLKARGFSQEDFAQSHPSGSLGKRLLWHVSDVMRMGQQLPLIKQDATLQDAITVMSQTTQKPAGLVWGITMVVDDNQRLIGIYTDGDLRRTLTQCHTIQNLTVGDVMSQHPKTIASNKLAFEAAHHMTEHKITALVVVDEQQRPIGLLHLHDLMQRGII